jgi:hypothetical protein
VAGPLRAVGRAAGARWPVPGRRARASAARAAVFRARWGRPGGGAPGRATTLRAPSTVEPGRNDFLPWRDGVVHRDDPLDTVRRTVTRATRPALAPLRVAAATLHAADAILDPGGHDAADRAVPPHDPGETEAEAEGEGDEPVELTVMRHQLAAVPDVRTDEPTDRALRATRSASAYLEARRARLKRELRELGEAH